MRIGRLVIGLVVILGSLWVLVGEQLAGTSADAVVNARLSTLRAPIAGHLALSDRALGARVQAGEELGAVADPLVDRIRLDDLVMERDLARAALARAEALVSSTQGSIAALEERGRQYRAERIAEIEGRLEHARARLRILAAEGPEVVEEGGLEADLAKMLDEGQSEAGPDAQVASVAREYARERVRVLEVELRAARAGVFLATATMTLPSPSSGPRS